MVILSLGSTGYLIAHPTSHTAVPYMTVYRLSPPPPGPMFYARYLDSSWNSAGAKRKRSALETSRRELSEDVSFAISTLINWLSSNRAWKNAAVECDKYVPSYTLQQQLTMGIFFVYLGVTYELVQAYRPQIVSAMNECRMQ